MDLDALEFPFENNGSPLDTPIEPAICPSEVLMEDSLVREASNHQSNQQTSTCPPDYIPKIGMQFESENQAYDFYNRYAYHVGFSIRRGSCHKLAPGEDVRDRTFLCFRAGLCGKDKRDEFVQNPRAETRVDCPATMKIKVKNGAYCVYEFVPDHNHTLATPGQVHRLRSHKNPPESEKIITVTQPVHEDPKVKPVPMEESDIRETSNPQSEQQSSPCPPEHIPNIGMKFESENEAYDFYNRYAYHVGFSIRKGSSHRLSPGEDVRDRTYCCSRAGTRGKDKRDKFVQNPRSKTRIDCPAIMKIRVKDGAYCVYKFVTEHNHSVATPNQVHRLRSHRNPAESEKVVTKSVREDPKVELRRQYNEVCGTLVQIAARAAESPDALKIVQNYASLMLRDVEECLKSSGSSEKVVRFQKKRVCELNGGSEKAVKKKNCSNAQHTEKSTSLVQTQHQAHVFSYPSPIYILSSPINTHLPRIPINTNLPRSPINTNLPRTPINTQLTKNSNQYQLSKN